MRAERRSAPCGRPTGAARRSPRDLRRSEPRSPRQVLQSESRRNRRDGARCPSALEDAWERAEHQLKKFPNTIAPKKTAARRVRIGWSSIEPNRLIFRSVPSPERTKPRSPLKMALARFGG